MKCAWQKGKNLKNVLFQPISNADFIVPVEIDSVIHQVRFFYM
jgi:hypothetical protein